jgi:Polysaccharide deacetylase
MPLQLPDGKRLAACLSPDFDAHSVWIGTVRSRSQNGLSRGEFGAEVGAPRLLDTFRRYGITTTWCVPTNTIQTFRAAVNAVIADEHEIAAHGGSWYVDDFPELETSKGGSTMQSNEAVLSRWKDSFDFAHERWPNGLMTWPLHPQTIGRSQHLVMLERFLDHVRAHDDIWFPTLSEAFHASYD